MCILMCMSCVFLFTDYLYIFIYISNLGFSENVDNERMEKSLLKSLDRQIKEFGIKKISSIFFGGGMIIAIMKIL